MGGHQKDGNQTDESQAARSCQHKKSLWDTVERVCFRSFLLPAQAEGGIVSKSIRFSSQPAARQRREKEFELFIVSLLL